MCFGNFIQISLVSLGQRRAEIARAGCQGYINLKSCSNIRNTDTIISFAFLVRVTIHFYQSRRFIRSHFCHKAGAKWSKISETKGNAKQNMESDRANFAGKISKRPEQIWARPIRGSRSRFETWPRRFGQVHAVAMQLGRMAAWTLVLVAV